jgi:hypothetical protein
MYLKMMLWGDTLQRHRHDYGSQQMEAHLCESFVTRVSFLISTSFTIRKYGSTFGYRYDSVC